MVFTKLVIFTRSIYFQSLAPYWFCSYFAFSFNDERFKIALNIGKFQIHCFAQCNHEQLLLTRINSKLVQWNFRAELLVGFEAIDHLILAIIVALCMIFGVWYQIKSNIARLKFVRIKNMLKIRFSENCYEIWNMKNVFAQVHMMEVHEIRLFRYRWKCMKSGFNYLHNLRVLFANKFKQICIYKFEAEPNCSLNMGMWTQNIDDTLNSIPTPKLYPKFWPCLVPMKH